MIIATRLPGLNAKSQFPALSENYRNWGRVSTIRRGGETHTGREAGTGERAQCRLMRKFTKVILNQFHLPPRCIALYTFKGPTGRARARAKWGEVRTYGQ